MCWEPDNADSGEDSLELGGDGAVDEEAGGEVDHDEEVGEALQAHDPLGRNVAVQLLHARHLHICTSGSVSVIIAIAYIYSLPTKATTITPRNTLRALHRRCIRTMDTRVIPLQQFYIKIRSKL